MQSTDPGNPAGSAAGAVAVAKAPAIEARSLSKQYDDGQVVALREASLSVADGEFVAIMGASGSGKSTLLHLIGTLDEPDTGEISFWGTPLPQIGRLDRFRARNIGFVFQMHFLLPHLTLLDNVAVPLEAALMSRREALERSRIALERVGLGHRVGHVPNKVSGGERQRAAIARAIVSRPRLLLADEPTGNVDSGTEEKILDLFAELRSELGATFVVVTHDAEVAARADRIVTMKDGVLSSGGTASSGKHNAILGG